MAMTSHWRAGNLLGAKPSSSIHGNTLRSASADTALGYFRRNPEAGFTLYGTASGGRVDGFVAVMSYPLAPGRAHDARRGVVRKALEDLKAVAVDYLEGVVVGKLGGRTHAEDDWLALDKWSDLDEDTLCRKLKVFVFLPPDWNQRRRARFERVTGYRVTESIEEAQAARGPAAPTQLQAGPAGIYRGRQTASRN
jgi:hypothetical protein